MSSSGEQWLRSLLHCVPMGMLAFRREGAGSLYRLRFASPTMRELMPRVSFDLGADFDSLFPDAARARLACHATLEDGVIREVTLQGEFTFSAHRLDPDVIGLVANDRGARASSELRRTLVQLDAIVEQVPAMIFVKDAAELRFQRFNRAGEELLGIPRSDLLGKNDFDLFPVQQAEAFTAKDREVLMGGGVHDIPEEPIQTPHGQRWLHTRKIPLLDEQGVPQALLGISVDVTERRSAQVVLQTSHDQLARAVSERTKALVSQVEETERAQEALARTEEQLRQAQKMEAIGRLAGGVAHDFNNMLSVVFGYCDLALSLMPPGQPIASMVLEIQRAGQRAAELTRRLLAFSRQQVLRPRVLDLSEVVETMQGMLERLVGEDIELRVKLSRSEQRVHADPHQLEQVLMNLVVNARDAMPEGGKLTIETSQVTLDEDYVVTHFGARTGPHSVLSVSDTGIGMDAKTRERIFEPFFTTKEAGKGTGLGLSTVHGVVQQSEGSIWVYSEPGRGTTFKIYLPVIEGVEVEPPRAEKAAIVRGGGEVLLLVEDDEQLRMLTAQILRRHGFDVVEATNGKHAREVLQGRRKVDALLTDVVMPEVGGRVLAEELLKEHPKLKVLYMSGYTDDAVVHHGVLERDANYLQKPFTPSALVLAVRAVLDA